MTTDISQIPNDLITIAEAAKIANRTHRATVRRWILRGKLKAYVLAGSRWLVSRADVARLIQPYDPPEPPTDMPLNKRDNDKWNRWRDGVLKAKGLK